MNIKSLLLGSAAALAVVSGAQAADAIVAAEPEPMEYVRVCDAYGTGYFYIPGTETCLRIGGRVRFDVQAANSYYRNSDYGWGTNSRAELNVDTASDTEYGALRTQIVARFDYNPRHDWDNGGANWDQRPADGGFFADATRTRLIAANIQLAGFTIGLADSVYSSFIGGAGNVINDDVISYGPFELNQINYTYDAGNGFRAVIALEDDGQYKVDRNRSVWGGSRNASGYMVDVVAGASYTTGAFGFTVVGGYDESMDEGAIKARVDATFGNVNAFLMGGWNTDDKRGNKYAAWAGEWAVWGGLGAKFTDTLGGNLQVAYSDSYANDNVLAIAANVQWNPVQNLLIQPEVTYTKWDNVGRGRSDDQWNGMIRFERQF